MMNIMMYDEYNPIVLRGG